MSTRTVQEFETKTAELVTEFLRDGPIKDELQRHYFEDDLTPEMILRTIVDHLLSNKMDWYDLLSLLMDEGMNGEDRLASWEPDMIGGESLINYVRGALYEFFVGGQDSE